MNINYTVAVLCAVLLVVLISFWYAQHNKSVSFDAFDLIMENGRVSRIAVAFMLVLAVSTWVIVDLQLKGKLTEGFFTIYTGAWIIPLVAKVVFNKSEMPTSSTFTSTTQTTQVVEPVKEAA